MSKKSKDYLVIGSDEYNFFESIDNGKTWRQANNIEYDSLEYDPSTGEPTPPDIDSYPSPEHGPIIIPNLEEIEYPYYYKDPGNIIKKEPNGEEKIIIKDIKDKPPFTTEKPHEKDENGNIIINIHNEPETINIKIIEDPDGNIIDKKLERKYDLYELLKNSTFSMDYLLLYILNEIIIPDLSFELMSRSEIINLHNDKFDLHTKFYTNSELYITFEGIDFEADVGMRPLRKEDFKLYKEIQKSNDELINEFTDNNVYEKAIEDELNNNDELRYTYSVIDATLNAVKKNIQEEEINNIEKIKEDYSGLSEEEYPIMKYFYSIRKGSEESILGTIINSIFKFNNSKKLALLKTSILNVAYNLKEGINFKLNTLRKMIFSGNYSKEKVINSDIFNSILDFNLIDEWYNSLIECILKYYEEARNNIFSISDSNDKEMIMAASNKYRSLRETLINEVSKNLPNIEENRITNDENVIELNNKTNKLLNELSDNISKCINDSDLEEKINNLLIKFGKEEEELLKDLNFINNILYYHSGIFKGNLDGLISENNKALKDIFYFDEMDYYDDLYGFSQSDIDKTFGYYRQIIEEFKKRCILLYNLSGESIIKGYINDSLHIVDDLNIWKNNLLISKDREQFINDNNLSYLLDNTKDSIKDLFKITNSLWNEAKGRI